MCRPWNSAKMTCSLSPARSARRTCGSIDRCGRWCCWSDHRTSLPTSSSSDSPCSSSEAGRPRAGDGGDGPGRRPGLVMARLIRTIAALVVKGDVPQGEALPPQAKLVAEGELMAMFSAPMETPTGSWGAKGG